MRFGEAGFPTEVHRTTVGLRWGMLRRVRYCAVDMWSSDEEGFPLKGLSIIRAECSVSVRRSSIFQ